MNHCFDAVRITAAYFGNRYFQSTFALTLWNLQTTKKQVSEKVLWTKVFLIVEGSRPCHEEMLEQSPHEIITYFILLQKILFSRLNAWKHLSRLFLYQFDLAWFSTHPLATSTSCPFQRLCFPLHEAFSLFHWSLCKLHWVSSFLNFLNGIFDEIPQALQHEFVDFESVLLTKVLVYVLKDFQRVYLLSWKFSNNPLFSCECSYWSSLCTILVVSRCF